MVITPLLDLRTDGKRLREGSLTVWWPYKSPWETLLSLCAALREPDRLRLSREREKREQQEKASAIAKRTVLCTSSRYNKGLAT